VQISEQTNLDRVTCRDFLETSQKLWKPCTAFNPAAAPPSARLAAVNSWRVSSLGRDKSSGEPPGAGLVDSPCLSAPEDTRSGSFRAPAAWAARRQVESGEQGSMAFQERNAKAPSSAQRDHHRHFVARRSAAGPAPPTSLRHTGARKPDGTGTMRRTGLRREDFVLLHDRALALRKRPFAQPSGASR
jgi:hypothetical protein